MRPDPANAFYFFKIMNGGFKYLFRRTEMLQ
jgi:hypothetical protein